MAISLNFLQSTTSATDLKTYTFSNQYLGNEYSDRYIIVTVSGRKSGVSTTITNVTVAGIEANIVVQQSNYNSSSNVAGIAIVSVPSGTTGDVVVTFGATMLRSVIGVYSVTGLTNGTPTSTATSIDANPTATLNILQGGFVIGASGSLSSYSTWTGLTENFDVIVESISVFTAASDIFTNGATGHTITINTSANNAPIGVFAAWGNITNVNNNFFLFF